jgi:integrase
MSIFARGRKLYAKIKDVSGKWQQVATGFSVGEEDKAARWLSDQRRQVEAARAVGATGPLTVATYSKPWLRDRKDLGLDWTNDEARLRLHILPVIGHVLLVDVHASHLARLVLDMRKAGRHSPRTIRNVYSVIAAMLRDAEIAGLIDRAPAKLTTHQLGPLHDSDPDQRGDAVFTHAEVEQLIGSPLVPPDRRVVYALEALSGLRHGEVAGLRWHRYQTREPLHMLVIATSYDKGRTKTGAVRRMPVHPALAAVLDAWRRDGWPAMMRRAPGADDLIVPLELDPPKKRARSNPREGGMRSKNDSRKRWLVDLAALGLRHRRGHDLRATFITLAEQDGADPAIISRLTHTAPGRDAYSGYSRPVWETYCREVGKLQIRGPVLVEPPALLPPEGGATDNHAWIN